MKTIIPFICLLLTCCADNSSLESTTNENIEFVAKNELILDYSELKKVLNEKTYFAYFDSLDLQAVHAILSEIEYINNHRTGEIRTQNNFNLENYQFQFIPFINSEGEKEIFVIGYCETNGKNPKIEIISSSDSKDCHIQLIINPANMIYRNYSATEK